MLKLNSLLELKQFKMWMLKAIPTSFSIFIFLIFSIGRIINNYNFDKTLLK
jgi:hypothetical protein